MKFDGKPSRDLGHRPFFSIVIACYNSRKTLGRLLDSVLAQDKSVINDIEVILSDDCSTESYDDIVDQYKDKICIKRIQTDYNCCPGNTREKGISIVEGEWLMICDHDDVLEPNSLHHVKNVIQKYNEELHVYTDFHEYWDRPGNKKDNFIRDMTELSGWNHGKFFNMDNLWRKYDIHFVKDMKTHEDIYITAVVTAILKHLHKEPMHIKLFTYTWHKKADSVSNTVYTYNGEPHAFLEVYFQDYSNSTAKVWKDQLKAGRLSKNYIFRTLSEILLYEYFYMQGFLFHEGKNFIKENIEVCRTDYNDLKELCRCNREEIFGYLASYDARKYVEVFETAKIGTGPFIPVLTFEQWLKFLETDSLNPFANNI